jgi:hypothetical protein
MHILIVNFNLKGISQQEYQALCDKIAPVFATIPGLISKLWLADAESNTYGGVYSWQDRAAMEGYMQSEIFRRIANHPNLENVTARTFDLLDGPTQVTKELMLELAL